MTPAMDIRFTEAIPDEMLAWDELLAGWVGNCPLVAIADLHDAPAGIVLLRPHAIEGRRCVEYLHAALIPAVRGRGLFRPLLRACARALGDLGYTAVVGAYPFALNDPRICGVVESIGLQPIHDAGDRLWYFMPLVKEPAHVR